MNRRSPTPIEMAASALLHMAVSDGKGGVQYLFTFEERKSLAGATPWQIVSLFEWDHDLLHTYGGDMHPTNMSPRLYRSHRMKSVIDNREVKKATRIAKSTTAHREAMAAKLGLEPDKQPDAPESKRKGFESARPVRKPDKPKWGNRPMPSRPFQKGHRPMRGRG